MTQEEIFINEVMRNYMTNLFESKNKTEKKKDILFNPKRLSMVNSSVRNGNYYMLDRYGLVIRKNQQNSKKTAFGWRYDSNNEPINIHIGDIMLQTNSDQIRKITLQQMKYQWPNLFTPPRGLIYKVYSELFPEINLETI